VKSKIRDIYFNPEYTIVYELTQVMFGGSDRDKAQGQLITYVLIQNQVGLCICVAHHSTSVTH